MALDIATGTFNIGTGAVGTTVSVTGLAFQPKVVIFLWSGRTVAGNGEASHRFGMGFMVSATDRVAVSTISNHDLADSSCQTTFRDDACIATLQPEPNDLLLEGAADFDAFLSDGFRLVIDDAFPVSYLISYLALGGTDLTDVKSVDVAFPEALGDQDITTVGFQPDAAIALGPGFSLVAGQHANFMLGLAAGATPSTAMLYGWSRNFVATTSTSSYCRAGDFLGAMVLGSFASLGTLTAWLSNGFRLNWTKNDAGAFSDHYRVLCLKGGQYAIGDALTSTGTTNQTENTPFEPKALLVASHNKVQSTSDTPQATNELSVGFARSATSRSAAGILDKNASARSDVGIAHRVDEMYVNQSTAATIAIEGLMDLVSFNATPSFTYVMDDADPAQAFFAYMIFADSPFVQLTRKTLLAPEWQSALIALSSISFEWQGALIALSSMPLEWVQQISAEVIDGFVAAGAPVPRLDEPEETCYDDIELRFTGETLIRWLPRAPVIKRRRPRQPRITTDVVAAPVLLPTIEPSQLILAHQSVSDVRFDGTATIEWHPWEGIRARDDETALLYVLFRQ